MMSRRIQALIFSYYLNGKIPLCCMYYYFFFLQQPYVDIVVVDWLQLILRYDKDAEKFALSGTG